MFQAYNWAAGTQDESDLGPAPKEPRQVGGRKDRDTKSQERMSSVGGWGVKVRKLWEQRVMESKRRGSSTATRGDCISGSETGGLKAWRLN